VALAFVFTSGLIARSDAQQSPPLLRLSFSPDGEYVLAQDAEDITVLATDPFAVRLQIPAQGAALAQFTPNSDALVFVRSGTLVDADKITVGHGTPKVERWSLADDRLAGSIPLPDLVCGTSVLAPDGRTYACNDYNGRLRVIDVASSETILDKEKFVRPVYSWIGPYRYDYTTDLGGAVRCFSPDGRVLIAIGAANRQWSNSSGLIWDVLERRPIQVKGLAHFVKDGEAFAFLDSGHVLIEHWRWTKGDAHRARIVTFPDGRLTAIVTIPDTRNPRRAADPDFLVVTPLTVQYVPLYGGSVRTWVPTDVTVAVELATGQMIVSQSGTLDVYGDHYVTEVRLGEIGLYERGKGLQASVVLHKN